MATVRVWIIKFRDGQTLQTIPTDLPITAAIEQACAKAHQVLDDVVAVRQSR